MTKLNDNDAALDTVMAEINATLAKYIGAKDPDLLLHRILGRVLADYSYNPNDLGGKLEWVANEYVAAKVGPLWPRLLRLHQFLAHRGPSPYDFQHADRYGIAFANEVTWKSMALQTQSYTYLLVLERREILVEEGETYRTVEDYAIHLRSCTAGPFHLNLARPDFSELAFLRDPAAFFPSPGCPSRADDYFRGKDGGDRGYLCSVVPDSLRPGRYSTKHVLRNFDFLENTIYILDSHCAMVDEEVFTR